jgi:crossover junction endodeoxyribonuclease RuvC
MLTGGVIRTDRHGSLAERLLAIHTGVTDIITAHRPDVMAVEALFNARNPRSSLVLGHARGAILLAGAQAGLPVVEYAPREVKQALTGNGAAAKEQVRFMVVRLLRLRGEPALDESDALAVALAHAGRAGRGPR